MGCTLVVEFRLYKTVDIDKDPRDIGFSDCPEISCEDIKEATVVWASATDDQSGLCMTLWNFGENLEKFDIQSYGENFTNG